MTRLGIAAMVIPVMLILSGCTYLTVKKVGPTDDTSKTEGQRFSLPKPYIQVTPKEDGSISAQIIYLPDPEHSYVVNSFSFLTYDALEVSTEDGIIKSINWTGDSSAVVADAIASSGTAASGILQAEQTKKAEQKAKEDNASKAVDDARLELDIAQSTLAFHTPNDPKPAKQVNSVIHGKTVDARLAFQVAALKLSATQAALARIRGTATSNRQFREMESAMRKAVEDAESKLVKAQRQLEDLIKKGNAAPETITKVREDVNAAMLELRKARADLANVTGQVFGPKLFAIRDEIRKLANGSTSFPSLEIVPVEQHAEETDIDWNPAQPKYPVKWPDAPTVRIFPEGVNIVPDQANNNSTWYALQSSVPLVRLVETTTFKDDKDGTKVLPLPPITLVSPTVITVKLEGIKPGVYTLNLAYQTPDAKDGSTPVKFKIVK